ncbi:hypothetical protein Tdes44962_MAKER06081 [Teratosphaeria destructans]|uniref:Uncharacterized protein n=1 Tax=Teratosphaeria destructans TaxID=418781 RepID=A0A9W7SI81_9PEZI|nr:hypothetical protein Tdes44962_MAKER06081 [Teratosphaeria destructans]
MAQRPFASIIRSAAQSSHAPAGTRPVGNYGGFGAFLRDASSKARRPPKIQRAPPAWRFLIITPAMIESRRERGMFEWSWHDSDILPPESEDSSSGEEEEEGSDEEMPTAMRMCMGIMI